MALKENQESIEIMESRKSQREFLNNNTSKNNIDFQSLLEENIITDEFGRGRESKVYLMKGKDSGNVLKKTSIGSITGENSPIKNIFIKTVIHNSIFPETKYEFIGFKYNGEGILPNILLKQSFVEALIDEKGDYVPVEWKKFTKFMEEKGFVKSENGRDFENNKYILTDMSEGDFAKPTNVLQNKEGEIRVIDPLIKIKDTMDFGEWLQELLKIENKNISDTIKRKEETKEKSSYFEGTEKSKKDAENSKNVTFEQAREQFLRLQELAEKFTFKSKIYNICMH